MQTPTAPLWPGSGQLGTLWWARRLISFVSHRCCRPHSWVDWHWLCGIAFSNGGIVTGQLYIDGGHTADQWHSWVPEWNWNIKWKMCCVKHIDKRGLRYAKMLNFEALKHGIHLLMYPFALTLYPALAHTHTLSHSNVQFYLDQVSQISCQYRPVGCGDEMTSLRWLISSHGSQ